MAGVALDLALVLDLLVPSPSLLPSVVQTAVVLILNLITHLLTVNYDR